MNEINIEKIRQVHFIGIGGIGMSALAQLFLHEGKTVRGSDKEKGITTTLIEKAGGVVFEGHAKKNLSDSVDLVVYSDAVAPDNSELVHARELKIPLLSYFEVLGKVSKNKNTIAVSGTHGKTTTTGMLTKILVDAGKSPTAIVGSIVKDFKSNFIHGESNLLVVEACEYKEHVLKLSPKILVVTNIEFDHSDFFKNLSHVQDIFQKAMKSVPKDGVLITNPNDKNVMTLLEGLACKVVDYTKEKVEVISMPGEFNRMNAQAAKAAAKAYSQDISEDQINKSLKKFKGVWRRFEYRGKTKNGTVVYDDYAHHPTAIQKTLAMVRKQFPRKQITVLFHPHLYSRTRSFFDGFVQALALADGIGILPIYAAREKEDAFVSSQKLVAALQKKGSTARFVHSFDEAKKIIQDKGNKDLIITMGAGDIYKVSEQFVSLH